MFEIVCIILYLKHVCESITESLRFLKYSFFFASHRTMIIEKWCLDDCSVRTLRIKPATSTTRCASSRSRSSSCGGIQAPKDLWKGVCARLGKNPTTQKIIIWAHHMRTFMSRWECACKRAFFRFFLLIFGYHFPETSRDCRMYSTASCTLAPVLLWDG